MNDPSRITPRDASVDQRADEAARHDAAIRERVEAARVGEDETVYHDALHPAVTGTGTDDNRDETGDPAIGATIGGVGGALVGAAAGSILGPAGSVVGAVIGGLTGAGASGLAVDAIDQIDDDRTVIGLDDGTQDAVEGRITDEQREAQRLEAERSDVVDRAGNSSIIV
jgi:outer membrane lipoprotein SlyB